VPSDALTRHTDRCPLPIAAHQSLQGPMETPKKYSNPYSHTPSRAVMQGGVQKKLGRILGSRKPTQLETIRDSPAISPSPRRTEPLELSPGSRPSIEIKSFGSAQRSTQRSNRMTPRRVTVKPRGTPLRMTTTRRMTSPGFSPPPLDDTSLVLEQEWDDEFANGVVQSTAPTPHRKTTPGLELALAEEVCLQYDPPSLTLLHRVWFAIACATHPLTPCFPPFFSSFLSRFSPNLCPDGCARGSRRSPPEVQPGRLDGRLDWPHLADPGPSRARQGGCCLTPGLVANCAAVTAFHSHDDSHR
jgi:hypothetical protein